MLFSEFGAFDLPQYNPNLDGISKNRFTYLFQLMHQTTINENYHWPIHKYDDEQKKVVSTWGPAMTCAQEPRFIANPEGTDEEDGLILTTVYDF